MLTADKQSICERKKCCGLAAAAHVEAHLNGLAW